MPIHQDVLWSRLRSVVIGATSMALLTPQYTRTIACAPRVVRVQPAAIHLIRTSTLVRSGDSALLAHPYAILRDHRGRFWLTFGRKGPPEVYDANGHFLKSIGRMGRGPGEFQFATGIRSGRGESIIISD